MHAVLIIYRRKLLAAPASRSERSFHHLFNFSAVCIWTVLILVYFPRLMFVYTSQCPHLTPTPPSYLSLRVYRKYWLVCSLATSRHSPLVNASRLKRAILWVIFKKLWKKSSSSGNFLPITVKIMGIGTVEFSWEIYHLLRSSLTGFLREKRK